MQSVLSHTVLHAEAPSVRQGLPCPASILPVCPDHGTDTCYGCAVAVLCSWAGLAMAPGPPNDVWLQSIPFGVERLGTVLQEFIHNFGIIHGWSRAGVEYEDYTTSM